MTEFDLFAAAIALPDPAARAALLDRECAADPALRERLEKLLAAHFAARPQPGSPADITQSLAADPDAAATGSFRPAPSLDEAEGVIIAGRYKLRQQIGEGGMGTVWMADQTEPVKRKVAVKLIRVERGQSKTILARFEAERQAIALMDHPHIAKLLDAGTTETGSPFFVMELVKGVPLNDFCDQHKLTIPERLNLFTQICSAVQHAHQKGIIHRDLKPSNILVESHDGKPVPKVIDFGLAKATTGLQLTEQSLFTAFGSVMGTPLYMAPEQATFNAIDIDTRADVYALGVILYELLTGTTPLTRETMKKAALDEMLRLVREQEAPTPSSRISSADSTPSVAASRQIEPSKLGRFVKGELDWIVMKALSKERDRRYETALGFAGDIERFLNHEPVTAGPPSKRYLVRKFVRRNRPQVIAASLVLLAMVAGVVGTTLGLLEARRQQGIALEKEAEATKQADIARTEAVEKERQRGRAETERERAEEFRDQALDALRATTGEDVEKLLGEKKELTANEKAYLEAIAKRWQTFAKQDGTDELARVIRAEGHSRVGYLWLQLGRREEARLEYEQAVALQEKLAADFPTVPGYRLDLAASHNNLGYLLRGLGRRAEAEEQYKKGLALQEKLAADFPTVPQYRTDLAASHNNLGILLADFDKLAEAEEQYRKSLALREKLAADFPTVPDYRSDLAASHVNLGNLLARLGKGAEAEEQYRKSLALQEKLAADFPTEPQYRSVLATSHNNLGVLLKGLDKRTEAEEHYRKSLALQEKLAADFPAVPDHRSDLANKHVNLGNLMMGLGKRAEAEEQYKKGLALREKLVAEFPTVPQYRSDLANSYVNLAIQLAGLGKRVEAEEQYRKSLALKEKLAADFPIVPDYRSDLAKSHVSLGNLLASLGKLSEMEEHYKKALALEEKLVAEFPAVPDYMVELGRNYCNLGIMISNGVQPAESLAWFEKAIATLARVHKAEPQIVEAKLFLRISHSSRAMAYVKLKRYAEAVKDWDRAVELSPKEEQPALRASRAASRAKAGMVAEAVAEVTELTNSSNWTDNQWYNFACVYAVASGKMADKKQEYADRAMELLAKAVKLGYKDADRMKTDTELDPLRERDDFKKQLAELEAKNLTPKGPSNSPEKP